MCSLLQLFCWFNSIIIAASEYHYLKYYLSRPGSDDEVYKVAVDNNDPRVLFRFYCDIKSVEAMELNLPEKEYIKRLLRQKPLAVCDSKHYHTFTGAKVEEEAKKWNEHVHEMLQKEPWNQPPITDEVKIYEKTDKGYV